MGVAKIDENPTILTYFCIYSVLSIPHLLKMSFVSAVTCISETQGPKQNALEQDLFRKVRLTSDQNDHVPLNLSGNALPSLLETCIPPHTHTHTPSYTDTEVTK